MVVITLSLAFIVWSSKTDPSSSSESFWFEFIIFIARKIVARKVDAYIANGTVAAEIQPLNQACKQKNVTIQTFLYFPRMESFPSQLNLIITVCKNVWLWRWNILDPLSCVSSKNLSLFKIFLDIFSNYDHSPVILFSLILRFLAVSVSGWLNF